MVADFVRDGDLTAIFCILCPILGFIFSAVYARETSRIVLNPSELSSEEKNLHEDISPEQRQKIWEVYELIYNGAHSFLYEEYRYIAYFIAGFSVVIFVVLGAFGENDNGNNSWVNAIFTVIAFLVGAGTSVLSGFIGMKIGVYANARTAVKCQFSLAEGFTTAFKAAVVMGFCLCSLGILNIYLLTLLFKLYYSNAFSQKGYGPFETESLFEAIAGYGLGGSSIALFGRVGGGIYTKAADVGADLVGKVEAGIPEDDPRNPAVIADNVGDNVGDIAGMGADLFGSFAESTCAALVIASQTGQLMTSDDKYLSNIWQHWGYVSFPLIISCCGILVCFVTSFLATHISPPREISEIEPAVKKQMLLSTVLMTPVLLGISYLFLPGNNEFEGDTAGSSKKVHNYEVFIAAAAGLWSGLIIGYQTEYYTSNRNAPVQDVAKACGTGAATNIIYGLALGYKSVIIPAITMALASFIAHSVAGFYGVAIAALGILSTLAIGLTIDAFGPISDNAGGIAEMCELGEHTRERTDALDAAGNTTAAIGKGFAIGSAAYVSLALFSGFVTVIQNRSRTSMPSVDILKPFPFAGLLVGAMLPYWFSAMTMKSVGQAAFEMVKEVREQFRNDPGILKGESRPDYDRCIRISTEASLYEMLFPGALVMLSPLVVGALFGVQALAGLLAGALVSGVQMAISSSNSGGAWDNAKKYIEKGLLGPDQAKGSESHKSAVVGDTVGDPLKDTSGPSLNILIKLMAITSLVFARAFPTHDGGLLGELADKIK